MELSERPRRIIVNRRSGRKAQVYIGIDFGTTYSKVSYSIAPSLKRFTIAFDDKDKNFFVPSIVYIDKTETNISFNSFNNSKELKYFKYNMINQTLDNNEKINSIKKIPKARLFSAFYLGCLIHKIETIILRNPELKLYSEEPEWYINIGVPICNYDNTKSHQKEVYDIVLKVGFQFARDSLFSENISITEFEKFYIQHENDYLNNLNSLSELYAEVLMYQQDNQVPAGFYAVVDVGGGTVDIATFHKFFSAEYGSEVECITQEIEALGVESLISRNANNADSKEEREIIRNYLCTAVLNYNSDFDSMWNIDCSSLNKHCFFLNRRLFRAAYGKCLIEAKEKLRSEMNEQIRNKQKLHCFLLGGGKSLPFYSQTINYMSTYHERAGLPKEIISDVNEYINNNPNLKEKDSRLLISQMLAQPFEKIPKIKNMPWNFEKQNPREVTDDSVDVDQRYPK